MTYYDLSKKLQDDYADLDEISKVTPLMIDQGGILRFEGNAAVRWIFHSRTANLSIPPDMNSIWAAYQREHWPEEDMRQLYRMMGYSLCGFLEIFHG